MTTPFPQQLINEFNDIRPKVRKLLREVADLDPGNPNEETLAAFEHELRRLLGHARKLATDFSKEEQVGAYDQTFGLAGDLAEALQIYRHGTDALAVELRRLEGTCVQPAQEIMQAAITWKNKGPAIKDMTRRDVDGDALGLELVIAQAAYMSGDMFGVSAALTLNPRAGLALFYDPAANADRDVRARLLRFYDGPSGKPHPRVALIPTTDCKAAYGTAIDGFFPPDLFPLGRPSIMPTKNQRVTRCVPIGTATRIVAEAYRRDVADAKAALVKEWLPPKWETGDFRATEKGFSLAEWVTNKFGDRRGAYAFLWFRRSGAKGGAHEELDTSVVATRELLETLRKGQLIQNAKIVTIGDRGHDLSKLADIDLTEYWDEEGSPFVGGDRRTQLALFAYLVRQGVNFMNIGMRSGALEGPALLGAKTVYLEEIYNFQEGRMEQWEGAVPGFQRVELGHVPTRLGKRVLNQIIHINLMSSTEKFAEAVAKLADLLGLTAKEIEAMVIANAARGIRPDQHVFRPPSVDEAFTGLCTALEGKLRRPLKSVVDQSWNDFRYWSYAAMRSAQARGKAEVKQKICTDYKGSVEGLSGQDKERLWQAVGGAIDLWKKAK